MHYKSQAGWVNICLELWAVTAVFGKNIPNHDVSIFFKQPPTTSGMMRCIYFSQSFVTSSQKQKKSHHLNRNV